MAGEVVDYLSGVLTALPDAPPADLSYPRELRGIERADSVVLDPHKSLFLPFGTGALLVRDVAALRAAHSGDDAAGYLHDLDELELPDFAALGPEPTRDTRGLRR